MSAEAGDTASLGKEVSFHPVAGGGVIFSAREGRLYALNSVAGLTWLCVKDGLSASECTAAISGAFNVEHSIASDWFSASMNMFKDFGLLETSPAQGDTPVQPRSVRDAQTRASRSRVGIGYELFDRRFDIAAPAELQPIVDSLLANLRIGCGESDFATQDEPRFLRFDLDPQDGKWEIAVDGRREACCSTESVAAEIERLLVKEVVPATPHLLTFHAAAVQHRGRSFLLAGESGSGKTTLSLALSRSGWTFGSDEIVLLDGDLRLRPLPLPPCVKADTFSTVETWFPHLRTAPVHDRYGKKIKYLPMTSGVFDARGGFVVFPRFDRQGENEIRPVDSLLGLQRLLAQCVFVPSAFRHEDVELLLKWHSAQQYFDVHYNSCDAAVVFLRDLWEKSEAPLSGV